ncbi:MAG: N-acetylneuraminate synthase family protein [Thermodesulfobacteriota bacterium]
MKIQLIAEIGSVHDGSFGNAVKLIEAAAAAGASAVKFQTHVAEAETLPGAPMPPYFQGEPRLEYFRRTAFTPEQWAALKDVAASCGVLFLSSPFAIEAVDLLEVIGVEVYKIPSGEVTNTPLLERVAATGKPILLSSGMSSWEELDRAVAICRQGGPLTVMQCTSAYPTPPGRVGLNVLAELRFRYGLPVGYSDHTTGNTAAIAAATLGATVIEKHFAFSRLMYGSDARHSSEPAEFAALAGALAEVGDMLASPVDKDDLSAFSDMKSIFEKSIVSTRPLPAGSVLGVADMAFKKPGTGLSAARYREFLGRRLRCDVPGNYLFRLDDFE